MKIAFFVERSQTKFISQIKHKELLKNFIDNLSDNPVNEYSSYSDDGIFCVFPKGLYIFW